MRLPVNRSLPLAALAIALTWGTAAAAKQRPLPAPVAAGPQADFPQVLGDPLVIDGVTYTPADTLNYDVVGYAAINAEGGAAISGSHRTLPLPSYVEVTALDSGRTILVRLDQRGPMAGAVVLGLSPAAAAQLGIADQARPAVRVRRVNPPEPERAALRAGQSAPLRMDTPPGLRTVLKRRLDQQGAGAQVSRAGPMLTPDKMPPVVKPAEPAVLPTVAAAPAPPASKAAVPAAAPAQPVGGKGDWTIQIGAFSSKERAEAFAQKASGKVVPTGKLWRVWWREFATKQQAEQALAEARAAGYSDARVQAAR